MRNLYACPRLLESFSKDRWIELSNWKLTSLNWTSQGTLLENTITVRNWESKGGMINFVEVCEEGEVIENTCHLFEKEGTQKW